MSGEDPRAGRKTPVEGVRRTTPGTPLPIGAGQAPLPAVGVLPPPVGPLPPVTPPPRLSPAPARLPQVVAPPKPAAMPTPRPAAGNNPFLDEAGPLPSGRVKKLKPPPAIISAGGVDMARGHAANVQPQVTQEGKNTEEAKVVVAVETDPRRVRTGPRLAHSGIAPDSNRTPAEKTLESARPPPVAAVAGASPWASAPAEVLDKKALPSSNLPTQEAAPPKEERRKGSPLWLRLSAAATLLLLLFAVARRFWMAPSGRDAVFGPVSTSIGVAPPLPDEPSAAATSTAAASAPVLLAPVVAAPPPVATDSAAALPSADPSAAGTDAPAEPASAAPRPRTTAPPPPRPTFKPLFELPQEKSKE